MCVSSISTQITPICTSQTLLANKDTIVQLLLSTKSNRTDSAIPLQYQKENKNMETNLKRMESLIYASTNPGTSQESRNEAIKNVLQQPR